MGRKLKRVPLDFEWPLGFVWKGYLNPYSPKECKLCDGSGYNAETKKLYDEWYSFNEEDWVWIEEGVRRYNNAAWQYHLDEDDVQALLDANRLWDFTHTWTKEDGWVKKDPPYVPTPEEVNEWAKHGMGHDSSNAYICVKAKAKRLGVYGRCPLCDGKGHYWCDDKYEKLYEEFEWIKPPEGDGYQLWETTSEGSPVSPVFETLDELCEWCAENATTFASCKASAEDWRKMLDKDFVHHRKGNMVFM